MHIYPLIRPVILFDHCSSSTVNDTARATIDINWSIVKIWSLTDSREVRSIHAQPQFNSLLQSHGAQPRLTQHYKLLMTTTMTHKAMSSFSRSKDAGPYNAPSTLQYKPNPTQSSLTTTPLSTTTKRTPQWQPRPFTATSAPPQSPVSASTPDAPNTVVRRPPPPVSPTPPPSQP